MGVPVTGVEAERRRRAVDSDCTLSRHYYGPAVVAGAVPRAGWDGASPCFVLDCIDDADTKTALIVECLRRRLPLLSSCSAGAKVDPTRIHIADIGDAISACPGDWAWVSQRVRGLYVTPPPPPPRRFSFAEDPLARKIRFLLRKSPAYGELPVTQRAVQVVYSSEKAIAKLTHLSQGHIDTPQEFGAVDNFRTGVLPVLGEPAMPSALYAWWVGCEPGARARLTPPPQPHPPTTCTPVTHRAGTIPAMFGTAMASYVLCKLAGAPITCVAVSL